MESGINRFLLDAIGPTEGSDEDYSPQASSNIYELIFHGQLIQVCDLGKEVAIQARYSLEALIDHWSAKHTFSFIPKILEYLGLSEKDLKFMTPHSGVLIHLTTCYCERTTCNSVFGLVTKDEEIFRMPFILKMVDEKAHELIFDFDQYFKEERERLFEMFTIQGDDIEYDIKELQEYGLYLDPKNYFNLVV
ncbi:MAG: hypothetical protein JXR10_01480 [Cyclobacteriaceae bacterium]